MTAADPLAISRALRAYYLSLPNRTADGWAKVMLDPGKYNQLWRHMLHHRCGQTALEINSFPPPIDLRTLLP